ncbi:MAG: stage II sporulation protein R [Oscillospiraceae bacterium]|nr:stage II sporulation protein R [Oscillospiraceae bacterium]
MKKYIFETALAIGLSFSLIIGALALDTQQDISDKLIRLHVIANSDSDEDQRLKLLVRDEILQHISSLTENCRSIDEAKALISKNLDRLEAIATSVIKDNGFYYAAQAELSEAYFPTKVYDSFSLPAGNYEALRIKLGEASGENWWCVLFPPVCVSAAEAEAEFESAGLTEDEIKLLTSDEPEYQFKFKIVEIIEELTVKK